MSINYFLTQFIDFIQLRKYAQYNKAFSNPLKAQRKSLDIILKRTNNCSIRKKLGISEVHSLDEFRKKCPITRYSDYEEFTQALFHKENKSGLLNREEASYFIATSGTTSKPKIFPVTEYYREEFQRVFLAWGD